MEKSGNRARLESTPVLENRGPGGWEQPQMGGPYYPPPRCLIRHSTQKAGKASYMGKDLTEVRSPQRKLVPDTVGPDKDKPTSLRGIANRAKARKDHKFRDLYRELDVELLRICWQDLNKDAASGVDGVTAQSYQEDLEANLQNLAERLKRKTYRAKLVRRCYIPKENGKERPLGIPTVTSRADTSWRLSTDGCGDTVQLLRAARELARTVPLLSVGAPLLVQVVEPPWWQTQELLHSPRLLGP